MTSLLSEKAKSLTPYVPGEQPRVSGLLKLNTNECPYPPSPKVFRAIRREIGEGLRRYPNPSSLGLLEAASRMTGIPLKHIFAGNGSDEILAFCFAAFYHGKQVRFPDITYSFYPVFCNLFDVRYETTPMNGMAINTGPLKGCGTGVILANPNAPTGECLAAKEIGEIARSNPDHVVLVDEAYVDFGGETCLSLLPEHPNLVVVQTLSKSRALAGMRIGLAFGDGELIRGLEIVRDSFNSYPVNRLSQAAGVAALGDARYYEKVRKAVIETREEVQATLQGMGFETTHSKANFLFVRYPGVSGEALYRSLREHSILVRHFSKSVIRDYIRITVGTSKEMERLRSALEDILEKRGE